MKTVFGSLPFYDSTDKQDVTRTKAIIPIHCPRTQLPPFQFDLGSDSIATVDRIELLDNTYDGTEETAGTDWVTDSGFDTFTNTGLEIASAINAAGICYANSGDTFSTIRGTQIRVTGTLTLNSGAAPTIFLGGPSEVVTLEVGANDIILTAISTLSANQVTLYLNGATNFSFTGVTITKILGALDITDFFDTLPQPYTPTDTSFDPYLKYNGDALNWLLPLGIYYVKITGDNYIYYSDYIRVDNLNGSNLITKFTNNGYETFTTSGTKILSAIETGASGIGSSDSFTLKNGETIKVNFYLTLNSGQLPNVRIYDVTNAANIDLDASVEGVNDISLTGTVSSVYRVYFHNTAAANFSTSEVWITRNHSPNFIKINFRNTDNFGNLLYEESQKQTAWLEAILNNPSHEMVNVGEEKDGIFIAEKITSKYIYYIIAYISRGMYQCLVRLPQHDDITITDEVGNTYTPAVGNVFVDPIEWTTYETGKLVIRFNDGAESSFSWTT